MQNLTCFRHPQYSGMSAPDLACKTCCSKFVARIRMEQNSQFEAIHNKMSQTFIPLIEETKNVKVPVHASQKFDSSWV